MPTLECAPSRPRFACLSTHGGHAGGAAIAMERLALGLRSLGAHVDIVTAAACPPATTKEKHLERGIRRAIKHGRTPVSNTLFTVDWPAQDVASHSAVVAADIVNVHWVAGFSGAAGIRRLVEGGKRVMWTLHDMRPFTGGCHYAAGCRGFTGNCQACPQLVGSLHELPSRILARARRRLSGVPLVFVAPSQWMADELERSTVFDARCHAVRVIPNGLDLDRYVPADPAAARARLGLPPDAFCILLGIVSLAEHRKGMDVALAALTRAARSLAGRVPSPLVVLSYGSGQLTIPGGVAKNLGRLDEAGVIEALHACDLHLTTAREDNLPNTVMESLACGRPVVGTAIGGIPDMVKDGVNGWLVPVEDAIATANVLERVALDRALVTSAGVQARDYAIAHWDARLQARRYLDLADAWPVDHVTPQGLVERSVPARNESMTPAAATRRRRLYRSGVSRACLPADPDLRRSVLRRLPSRIRCDGDIARGHHRLGP